MKEVPRTPVACRQLAGPRTMVALVFGQSNAANFGRGRFQPHGRVYEMAGRSCFVAADPLIGGSGEGASAWTRLGERLVQDGVFDQVVFVAIAVGGSEIARWAENGDLHPVLIGALDQAKGSGLEATHLLWQQGEQDAQRGTSASAYAASFASMVRSVRRSGHQAPIFVSISSYCAGTASADVRAAQAGVVSPAEGIVRGPDTDAFVSTADRYDDCHFSAVGLQHVSDAWASILAAAERESDRRTCNGGACSAHRQ